jgi:ribulose-5-phosphate 4-epimerase/fuculose-1-phosphate aldolase
MTPTGVGLGELRADGLARVALHPDTISAPEATVGARPGPRPTKEAPLHTAVYRRFPAARAVVHLHSPHAVAASCQHPWSSTSALAPLTPYLVMRVGRVPLAPYAAPGTDALAASLDAVAGEFRAVLLARHGSLVWGPTIEAALEAAVEVEEAARTALLAGPAADPLTPAQIQELTGRYGTPW